MSTTPVTNSAQQHDTGYRVRMVLCFFAVYFLWGTTFLAIRVAVTELPPLFAAAARFLIAGALLFGFMRLRGTPSPTRQQWRNLLVVGLLMFVAEYGPLFWAEKYLPSGIASVLAATIPILTLIMEMLVLRKQRWQVSVAAATLLGFAGVGVLVLPSGGGAVPVIPCLAILAGSSGWALGSVLTRSMRLPDSRPLTAGATMMLGGAILLVLSACFGELHPFPHISARAMLAVLYLIIVGSLLGFTAFVWLLAHLPATRVSSYAYVNPIVAVALGYFLAHEPISLRTLAGTALVVVAVVMILRRGKAS